MPTLSIRDYIYAGAILVLVIAFGLYTSHERSIGRAELQAVNDKLDAASRQHAADVKAVADSKTASNGDTYVATISKPVTGSPSVVCKRPAAAAVLPKAAGDSGVPVTAANSPAADSLDIGPPLDKTGRDADALITALQNQVRILVDAMNGVTAP